MKAITLQSEGRKFKPGDILRSVCETAPEGVQIGEMRQRLRILDALDKANGQLTLEDADHALLRSLLGKFRFAVAHADIVAAIDAVESAS